MSKTLAIFGATGQQGGSVMNHVLNDPVLSQMYKIRVITRDTNSGKAQELKKLVKVVQGDMLRCTTIETALTGVHTVFIMTKPSMDTTNIFKVEYNSGKTIADVAVEKGAKYIIFSTLPNAREISNGKYTNFMPFDTKVNIEKYIRSLPIQSAFISPGSFMENFHLTMFAPQRTADGTLVLARNSSPQTRLPFLDAVDDFGKFVGAILAEPDRYEGKTFCAATKLYSWEEIAAVMSQAVGESVVYQEISSEELKKSLSFPENFKNIFIEAMKYPEDFGYYGPDSEKLVAWAAGNARGRVSTLEEFWERNPLQLA